MTGSRGSWTGGRLTARSFLKPKRVAEAVFHPAWIPEAVDPGVERLKRVRVIAGAVAAVGVYTFVQGGFAFTEMLQNMLTASVVLLFITPLTVGAMLLVWRRTGTVRQLRVPLGNSFKLLLAFVGSIVLTVLTWWLAAGVGGFALVLGLVAIWLTGFVGSGAVKVSGNFFGTAAVHRCLPPLLATVTTWLMALPDLATGDLHGLSLGMGVVFILGAPVTVTAIAALEMYRLRRRHGIRLGAHPATLPPPVPSTPPAPPYGYLPPQGNPYGPGPAYTYNQGNPYAPGQRNPYNQGPQNPYTQGPQNPYNQGPQNPYNQQNPHGF
ncbi:hypothetical protein ACFVYV_37455 [Streptomyces mirabilis]|uniref:hypothetical protein n=1 Tax=Streptomyces TaxID=1883 RepID=UPI000BD20DB7|nr:hypothetical protein [Streptomyces sp. OV198]SOE76754.1 hypothetical protein SAMN05446589_6487 [Streptomyces sp. OV198]